jgi:hypothetical protein
MFMVQRQKIFVNAHGSLWTLGPADDHSPERSLGDVWSVPEP